MEFLRPSFDKCGRSLDGFTHMGSKISSMRNFLTFIVAFSQFL